MVFENGVLRRIFGHKRGEGAGGWGRLHSEELHEILLGCSKKGDWNRIEGKRLFGRPRRRL
jgi:hypothetical protein